MHAAVGVITQKGEHARLYQVGPAGQGRVGPAGQSRAGQGRPGGLG